MGITKILKLVPLLSQIAEDYKTVEAEIEKAKADGTVSAEEWAAIAGKALSCGVDLIPQIVVIVLG